MKIIQIIIFIFLIIPVIGYAGGVKEELKNSTANSEKKELLFLGYKGSDELGILPDIIKDYQKQRPDVTINYEYVAESNGYYDALKLRLASGEKVDLFMSDFRYISLYVDAGYVMDLTRKPVDFGLAYSYGQNILYGFRRNIVYNGKTYCFPFSAAGIGLFANMTILNEIGKEYPRNWKEFLETCEILKDRGTLPLIMGNKQGRSGMYFLRTAMRVEQAELNHQNEFSENGEISLSQLFEKPIEKFEYLIRENYTNGSESINLQIDPQVIAEFQEGKAAFMIGGTWYINRIISERAFYNFTFGPIPVNEREYGYAILFPVENIFINTKTEYPDEALQFLHFMALPWNAGAWAKSQAAFPTIVDAGAYEYMSEKKTPFSEAYQDGRIIGWDKALTELQNEKELRRSNAQFILEEISKEDFGIQLDNFLKQSRD